MPTLTQILFDLRRSTGFRMTCPSFHRWDQVGVTRRQLYYSKKQYCPTCGKMAVKIQRLVFHL